MKRRMGFVTNSSSTSYVVVRITFDEDEFTDELRLKLEKLLDAENVDYIIQLVGKAVDNHTGEVEREWIIDED